MLVIGRKAGEGIDVEGVIITVVELRGGRVRLGVYAPGKQVTRLTLTETGQHYLEQRRKRAADNPPATGARKTGPTSNGKREAANDPAAETADVEWVDPEPGNPGSGHR